MKLIKVITNKDTHTIRCPITNDILEAKTQAQEYVEKHFPIEKILKIMEK